LRCLLDLQHNGVLTATGGDVEAEDSRSAFAAFEDDGGAGCIAVEGFGVKHVAEAIEPLELEADGLQPEGFIDGTQRAVDSGPGLPASTASISAELEAVTLRYRLDTGQEISQRVPIEFVPCKPTRSGRYLWLCPTCGRRCRQLFSVADRPFRCFECYDIKYRAHWRLEHWALYRGCSIGLLLKGMPAGGKVPPPYRSRRDQPGKWRRQMRLHDALGILAMELLRDD
jgi:hypothetical protein